MLVTSLLQAASRRPRLSDPLFFSLSGATLADSGRPSRPSVSYARSCLECTLEPPPFPL